MNSRHEHEEHEEGSDFEDISFVIRPTEAFLQAEVDFLLKLHAVSEHCHAHDKAERHIEGIRQIYNNWKGAEYPSNKLQDVKESIQKGLQYIAQILKVKPPVTQPYRYHFLGDDIHKLVPEIDKIKASFMHIGKEQTLKAEEEGGVTAKSQSFAGERSGASSVAISHSSGSSTRSSRYSDSESDSESEINELEDISFVLKPPVALLHAEDFFLQTIREVLTRSTDNELTSKYLNKCLKNYEAWKAADYPNHQFATLSAKIEKWLDKAAASTNSLEASVHRPTEPKKHTFFKTKVDPKILSDIEQSMLCFESIETIKTTIDAMEKDLHSKHHP
jgi:hypothetical protein